MTAVSQQPARAVPRMLLRTFWAVHRFLHRITGGRFGLTRPQAGKRFGMLRLETVGHRSGKRRAAMIGYYEDGPNLVTMAMNGWGQAESAWWQNLRARPDTTVTLADGRRQVRARIATGAERVRLWATFQNYPGWGDNLDGLAALRDRETTVIVLEPRVGRQTANRQEEGTALSVRRIAIASVTVVALLLVPYTAPQVEAAGLRNCTEISGPGFARAGCWEDVWAGGAEYRMTFATGCCSQFKGRVPDDLDAFYVMAPQDATPQSLNAPFRHDHVVRDFPARNHGNYSVRLHGFFVICSASGIASGACVFEMNSPGPGFTLPFAKTVNGQSLTSVEPLEAAVDAGLISLVDTGAAIVGTINQTR